VTKATTIHELKDTIGDLSCTLQDASACGITTVGLVDADTGNFAAVFDNPKAAQNNEAGSIADRFLTNNFKRRSSTL
jgi:hypothetical protein